MLSRRHFLSAAALAALGACAAPAGGPAPPLDGPDALLAWMTAHPDQVSLLIDGGRGPAVAHLADRPRPIASAVKAVHLVAYAQAVAGGRLDPAGPVAVRDWERWYVPGADAGAHPRSLEELGTGPDGTVTWDGLATVMISQSDNAAADLVRETLGDDALTSAAAAAGWAPFDVPHIAGEALFALAPDPATPDRRGATRLLGRAWAGGEATARALGEQYAAVPVPGGDPETGWRAAVDAFAGSWSATAGQLVALHRTVADGGLGEPANGIVRGHLERGLADRLPDGVAGFGQKSGSLPGVLSWAGSVRRTDGTTGAAAVLLSGLSQRESTDLQTSGALLRVSQQALLDDATAARVEQALLR